MSAMGTFVIFADPVDPLHEPHGGPWTPGYESILYLSDAQP
jgi:hypothetical protein